MNFGHWMDGAWGVPTWLWLVAVAMGSLLVIFWVWAVIASSAARERVQKRRLYYLESDED